MFRMTMLDDSSAPALPLIELLVKGDKSVASEELIAQIADYVMTKQTRLEDGTFARPEPKWTIWADDLFMSVPFLVRYGRLLNDNRYFDEAAKQITGFDKHLYDAQTGLYYHGWNDAQKAYAGLFWGRANGWMAWAISEALLMIPTRHPQYQTILNIHRRQLESIAKYQNKDGMWRQLLNMPASYEETSATAIFVMTLARAVRNGWIDKNYTDNVVRGWKAIEKRIDSEGVVSGICQSTAIGDGLDFYLNRPTQPNDPRGMGSVLMAAVEVDKLLHRNERVIYNDPKTGNEVWQITNHPSFSNMPYFEAQAFTADDAWVVFKSDRDDGVWKIFRSNMATGELSKVSDMQIDDSFTIMPDGKRVAFMNNRTIYAVDVATLKTETIIAFEPANDRISFSSSFTADGKYTLVNTYHPNEGTRIFRVDVTKKEAEQVFVIPVRVSHTLINPRYPNLMSYVPSPDKQNDYDLSLEERARSHIVDTNIGTCKPFLMMPEQFRATHETWSHDGERYYFFRKMRIGNRGFKTVSICSVDKNGSDLKVYYTTTDYKLGHGSVNREQNWFITDSQDPLVNPLVKLDLASGEITILCWPNSSQTSGDNDQTDHVHPIISASGKYVAFTSDGNSRKVPQAFVIPVK